MAEKQRRSSETGSSSAHDSRKKRIIAMDGGGASTLVSLTMLEKVTAEYPHLWRNADYIGGTSAGAVNALILYAHDLTNPVEVGKALAKAKAFWKYMLGTGSFNAPPLHAMQAMLGQRAQSRSDGMMEYLQNEIFQDRTLGNLYESQRHYFRQWSHKHGEPEREPPGIALTTFSLGNRTETAHLHAEPDGDFEGLPSQVSEGLKKLMHTELEAWVKNGMPWDQFSEWCEGKKDELQGILRAFMDPEPHDWLKNKLRFYAMAHLLERFEGLKERDWHPELICVSHHHQDHADVRAVHAAMTSSAFPIYSPIFNMPSPDDPASWSSYVDGGVFAGNPGLDLIEQIIKEEDGKPWGLEQSNQALREGFLVLSVGIEDEVHNVEPRITGHFTSWGYGQWLFDYKQPYRLISLIVYANFTWSDKIMRTIFSAKPGELPNYHRMVLPPKLFEDDEQINRLEADILRKIEHDPENQKPQNKHAISEIIRVTKSQRTVQQLVTRDCIKWLNMHTW